MTQGARITIGVSVVTVVGTAIHGSNASRQPWRMRVTRDATSALQAVIRGKAVGAVRLNGLRKNGATLIGSRGTPTIMMDPTRERNKQGLSSQHESHDKDRVSRFVVSVGSM